MLQILYKNRQRSLCIDEKINSVKWHENGKYISPNLRPQEHIQQISLDLTV
jgi:hypothetical protein